MISDMVARQRAYFETGATRSLKTRIAALRTLQNALRQNEVKLAGALKADLHKSPGESYMSEIGILLDELRYAIKHVAGWSRKRGVMTPLAHFSAKSFVVTEPFGVVLVISPWNYPVQLSLAPVIGAIAAGNCVILKPSAYAPATSRALAEMIGECFDPAHVAVIEGGREQNNALLCEKFDYMFFTGSVAVGKYVMECAAKQLTPVTLELGGKSPVIVDETANISVAARRIVFGKVLNAGQTCVAPDYVLVQKSVREPFLKALGEAIAAFFPGGDEHNMPHIVSDKHFERLKGLMKSGTVYCGGQTDAATRHISLTVLDGVLPDDPVMQEEIFGPILPILPYETLEEAISFVNARPHPLALYLFTTNGQTEKKVLDSVRFGGGCVNDTIVHLANAHMGFGGIGDSGMGQYHGKKGFDTFTHYKSILKKFNWIDMPMRYHPYIKWKESMIRMLIR